MSGSIDYSRVLTERSTRMRCGVFSTAAHHKFTARHPLSLRCPPRLRPIAQPTMAFLSSTFDSSTMHGQALNLLLLGLVTTRPSASHLPRQRPL